MIHKNSWMASVYLKDAHFTLQIQHDHQALQDSYGMTDIHFLLCLIDMLMPYVSLPSF